MSNEQNDQTPEAENIAAAPSSDSQNRLSAAAEYAREQYERVRRATAEQMEHVRQYTQDARRQINEGWDATRAKAVDLHKAGEEYVRTNPTGSMLGALGVGLLLGFLLGSSRR